MIIPYVVGPPVQPAHLYGRDLLIERCSRDTHNNIWLLGRRRSGKTSVLLAIQELGLTRNECFPVYVDLSVCSDDADIKDAFLRQCRQNLKTLKIQPDELPLTPDGDFVDSVWAVYQWMNERDMCLVLLFDEIEHLEKLDTDAKLQRRLQNLANEGQLRLIVAAARVFRTRRRAVTADFIGIFRVEDIGAIPRSEARKLIHQEKRAGMEVQAPDEIVDEILKLTSCEPYLIQYLCDKLYQPDNSLRPPTQNDLTRLDVNLADILRSDYAYLEEKEKDILHQIVRGPQPDAESIPTELIQLRYIRPVNGHFAIGNHFLETWVQREVGQNGGRSNEAVKIQVDKKDESGSSNQLSKRTDLLISIFLPLSGLVGLALFFAFLVSTLGITGAIVVALLTALLGLPVLFFAGRSINIIGETTFYKLSSQVIRQIPLLSRLLIGGDQNLGEGKSPDKKSDT